MDKKLQRMIDQLRSEKCPPRVLGRVKERIGVPLKTPSHFFRSLGILTSSTAVLVLMTFLLFPPKEHRTPTDPQPIPLVPPSHLSNQQVAEETHLALALIGSALLEAGQKSGEKLFTKAIPPLMDGFETTKLKITRSSE